MAYLNVIPTVQPLPNVRGLGQVRLVLPPGRRRRGMGQGPAGAATCAEYLQNAFNALPSAAEAAMLLNTGSPSGEVLAELYINSLPSSPEETAQATVTQLAQEYCGAVAAEVSSADPNAAAPPDCGNNGADCASAALSVWQSYYNSLPSSVWTSGMVSAQVANPQAFPAPPAPAPAQNTALVQNAPTPTPAQTVPAQNIAPVVAPAASVSVPAQTSSLPSWLTGDIAGLPVWGWALGAAALLFLMPRGK